MRVISIEDHYTTQALRDARSDHPLIRGLAHERPAGAPQKPSPGTGQDLLRRLLDVGELRIASMDEAGIDVQVLSHTLPDASELEGEPASRLATEANDFAAQAIAAHPDRFLGFATLPILNPVAAAAELDRTVNSLGFVGALINGHVNGRYLDDQFFWPIFEAAEALDVPVYLHPTLPPQAVIDATYSGFSAAVNLGLSDGGWGWHIDTGLHTLRLITAGVFDRFPRLQLIIGHLGEALPSMIWRTGWMMDPITDLARPFQQYFTENVHVTTSGFFDYAPFAAALHALGVDRILFAVDYPYSKNEEAIEFLGGLPLSGPDREKIAHGNAERLFKLS